MQCREAGMDGRNRRVPQRGRNLHRMHDAWFSGQVHAVYESAARFSAFLERRDDVWTGHSCVEKVHAVLSEQRTVVESAINRVRKNSLRATRAAGGLI